MEIPFHTNLAFKNFLDTLHYCGIMVVDVWGKQEINQNLQHYLCVLTEKSVRTPLPYIYYYLGIILRNPKHLIMGCYF